MLVASLRMWRSISPAVAFPTTPKPMIQQAAKCAARIASDSDESLNDIIGLLVIPTNHIEGRPWKCRDHILDGHKARSLIGRHVFSYRSCSCPRNHIHHRPEFRWRRAVYHFHDVIKLSLGYDRLGKLCICPFPKASLVQLDIRTMTVVRGRFFGQRSVKAKGRRRRGVGSDGSGERGRSKLGRTPNEVDVSVEGPVQPIRDFRIG